MPSTTVADDPALLRSLIADANVSSALWQPTEYWRDYCGRIAVELERAGLHNFQSNNRIVKGYGPGGVPEAFGPVGGWKRAVWNALVNAPGFRRVIDEHRHLIALEHRQRRRAEVRYAAIVLDAIAEKHADLRIPSGIANGEPDDAFDWRGHRVTVGFVEHVARMADFYDAAGGAGIESIIEIGPGFGLSTLAHRPLNPKLKVVVNIDIVPVIYVSTQYLKSTGEFDVVDYAALRDGTGIRIESGQDRPRLYQLPPWLLPRLSGSADYFFNDGSFQEMNHTVCTNYAKLLLPLIQRGVMLHCTAPERDEDGAPEPVAMKFLTALFEPKFPKCRAISGLHARRFGILPENIALCEAN
jgi:putative sugar O-methyltransferase